MAESGARLDRKIREAREHPDYFGSMVLLDSELEAVGVALDTCRKYAEIDRERIHNHERAEQAEAELARAREAVQDALGRHQVTHIHAALRAALTESRGESAYDRVKKDIEAGRTKPIPPRKYRESGVEE
jgi:hypothetical protein